MASIRKRTWKTRGIERTAWVADYVDQTGARRLKTFPTRKEADAWAVTARHEVAIGTHTPASVSITVAEAAELWIKHCEAEGLEFGTIKQRRQHLSLHIAPFMGREKLSALSTPRVHQFDADLRAAGRSISMRRKVLVNLKTILSFAQRQGLVAQNVALPVKIKSDDRAESSGPVREGHDFPTKAEIKTIIESATGRWRPFAITAIFTGMRASELRGLAWSNVDLEKAIIHVRQRADAWGHIGKPKSKAGNRDIPLPPMVVNALKQWQLHCPPGELGLVFPNGRGNIESHNNVVKRWWGPLQVQSGMGIDTGKADQEGRPILAPKYNFHSLRHSAASLFIAHLGWTPKRVQRVMGHSSITMTFDRYGHLFEDPEADLEAMKRLEAAVVAA